MASIPKLDLLKDNDGNYVVPEKGIPDRVLSNLEFANSDMIEASLNFKGAPYSLDDFPYWRDIFNSPRLTKRIDPVKRKMVWMFSRQVGKSVGGGALMVGSSLNRSNFTSIFCMPTDPQISRFSAEVLKRFNTESVPTEYWYRDTKKTERQVKNMSYLGGSRIVLANIHSSVLSARGIPGDMVVLDEYADIPEGNGLIIVNALRRSAYKIIIYSGTPQSPENDLQKKFDKSTQNEWMVKCVACGYWNGPIGGDGTDKKLHNIGLKGPICDKCGKRIYPEDGEWVAGYPDANIDGYHANELIVPADAPGAPSWGEILYRIDNDPTAIVWNEMLGVSYTDAAFPIPLKLIAKFCVPEKKFVKSPAQVKDTKMKWMFAGIDWMMEASPEEGKRGKKGNEKGSYTILTIAGWNAAEGYLDVKFVKKYYDLPDFDADKPNEVLSDIISWLKRYKVRCVGCDYGVGHKENQRIAEAIGVKRVMEVQYLGTEGYRYIRSKNKFIFDRAAAIGDLIEAIKMGEFRFPQLRGETSEYVQDLTNIFKYRGRYNRVRYGKKRADDWLHSLLYLLFAQRLIMKDDRFQYKMK